MCANHQETVTNKDRKKLPIEVILYFSGIIIFLLGLILPLNASSKQILSTLAMLVSGYHVMWEGIEDTIKESRRQKRFIPNTHILMTMAAVGAVLLGEASESALLIFIFAGAHFLEEYVEGRSQREITKLLELNPTEARRLTANGKVEIVTVDQLAIGDRVQVLNGGQIPTDGRILEGEATIDESNISGESIPREKTIGDDVFGATINGNTSFIMEVTKDSSDTVFSNILQLVESSQSQLSPTASRIRQVDPYYVKAVLLIFILLVALGPNLLGWSWAHTFATSLTFLVSASPCALAVSAVPATLAGISNLAKQGVLFKGGSFLANLSDLKAIAFDKTGTLTEGKPQVVSFGFKKQGLDEDKLLGLIVAMEKQSNHPLAQAIVDRFEEDKDEIAITIENRLGQGIVADYEGHCYQIGKPTSFASISEEWTAIRTKEESLGRTLIFVAIDDEVGGYIAIQDRPQASAMAAIDYFKSAGVKTIMITGDAELTGQAIGRELGIDHVVANVMPEDKARVIKEEQESTGMIAMLGDGVNDAPALVTADIGIAMGDGTDVAIETADVVLMQNDLSKLALAHKLSKRLKANVAQNLIFSLLVVILLVSLTFWGNLSVLASVTLHEGSTLLVLLNTLRLLKK